MSARRLLSGKPDIAADMAPRPVLTNRSSVARNFCTAHLLVSAISRAEISCFDGLPHRDGGME